VSKPEHAPSQPEHHNVEPILASCVSPAIVSLPILPRNPFLLLHRDSAGTDFGLLNIKGSVLYKTVPLAAAFCIIINYLIIYYNQSLLELDKKWIKIKP